MRGACSSCACWSSRACELSLAICDLGRTRREPPIKLWCVPRPWSIESWWLGAFGEDPPSCGVCLILVKVLVVDLKGNIVIRASPHWWKDTKEITVCHITAIRCFTLVNTAPLQRRRSFHWEVNFGINSPRHFVGYS